VRNVMVQVRRCPQHQALYALYAVLHEGPATCRRRCSAAQARMHTAALLAVSADAGLTLCVVGWGMFCSVSVRSSVNERILADAGLVKASTVHACAVAEPGSIVDTCSATAVTAAAAAADAAAV
jgi:hypothetical protein